MIIVSESLENNKLIVLIDGLDEINITNQRHNIVERINLFIVPISRNKNYRIL